MNSVREKDQYILLCTDLMTPMQGQGQWTKYKMVEVNGACRQCRYEKHWLNRLCVTSNIKVFATQNGQMDSRLAGWTQLIM